MYTLGKDNSRADALSWRLDIAGTKEIISSMVLQQYKDRSLELAKYINNLIIRIRYDILEEL
jgi:hypothetical protein